MRLSEALRYRAAIEKGCTVLPDAELLRVPNLAPVWAPEKVFEAGERVTHLGVLYRCLQAHTAQTDWTPDMAASLWARVLIPDENVVPEWEQPDSTNPYQKGDQVMHSGILWESLVDENIWEPGVYGWKKLAE